MPRNIINRYLVRELLTPILLCLLVFTLVLMTGRLVQLADLVINKGVEAASLLTLLSTMLLPFMAIALPLAFLMGGLIGLGRLCADNEITALRATGVGLLNMARPVFALALICALLTALIAMWVAPWGKRTFKATLLEMTRSKASISLQKHLFIKQFKNLVLYADHLDERSGQMTGIFIVETQGVEGPLVIFADSGRLVSNPQEQSITLQLYDGAMHRQEADATTGAYQVIRFNRYDIRPNLGTTMTAPKFAQRISPNEMTMGSLWQATQSGDERGWAARAELHSRLCAPLAPILFALFILPFAMQTQRSGSSGGFTAGLLIYLIYYLLTSAAATLATELHIHPALSFWTLHLAFLLTGLYLLRQSALERPSWLLVEIDNGVLFIKQRLGRRNAHD
ncbi:MAG: LPS export ABC transporter permease LptF [Desulfuromonadales bacterium]|nr:LPS export ABC transporter permease LptF [Desulfuromonadales bacterium]